MLKEAQRMAAVCTSAKEALQGAWRKDRHNRLIMLLAAAAVAVVIALPAERFIAFLQTNP